MPKSAGLGDNLYVAGYDLSGDIGALDSISGGPSPLEVTGIDKSGYERIGGARDGGIEFTAFFNKATDRAHPRLKLLPTTDAIVSYLRGTALGGQAACLVGKQLNYDGNRGEDGSLTFKVAAKANGFGLEWGRTLTAGKRTDSAPTNGTGVDLTTVSTTFGWQAYLHVFAFAGTSVTVTLQDSADDSSYANLAGGAFTAASGVTSERLAGAGGATVRRYLRAITSGTFSNAVIAVVFVRNETAVVF
ncbi:MAG TPA: hypothetical protein VG276_28675 [Actinomycetes bacterium]|nr:hypothetical protein [Actinomycetes bacterium]